MDGEGEVGNELASGDEDEEEDDPAENTSQH